LRQILMTLIVWGLLVIANQDAGKLSPKQLWRELQARPGFQKFLG
jgi:hypothetical protein